MGAEINIINTCFIYRFFGHTKLWFFSTFRGSFLMTTNGHLDSSLLAGQCSQEITVNDSVLNLGCKRCIISYNYLDSIKQNCMHACMANKPIKGANVKFIEPWWCIYAFIYWGRVTHICVSKLSMIYSDHGLAPARFTLSEPILEYCSLDFTNKIQWNHSRDLYFQSRKYISNYRQEIGGYFVSALVIRQLASSEKQAQRYFSVPLPYTDYYQLDA